MNARRAQHTAASDAEKRSENVEIPEVDERWQKDSPLAPEPAPNRSRAMPAKASGSLVCGIISVALSLFSPLICWITGVVAIALATSQLRADRTDKIAKAGRILGVIGVIVGMIVFCIAFFTSLMVTAQYYGV